MLDKIKDIIINNKSIGSYGIEREGLRVTNEGKLALTPHPKVFEKKICNPYITTDFSESQIEVITPTFNSVEECYNFTNVLYDIVAQEIGDEYLWPISMPCILPEDKDIPIAEFCECPMGINARRYREQLMKKYGGKRQLISGIHYNFSFQDDFLKELHKKVGEGTSFREFKDNVYLKLVRNYLRYRWLIIYLLCGSNVIHDSFEKEYIESLNKINEDTYHNESALSYRNSQYGYKNNIDLYPNYDSVKAYVDSMNNFVKDKVLESHKELYSQVRLKAADIDNFLESLEKDGIKYLEYRSLDINPFEKGGISLNDLKFLEVFNIFLLVKEESDYEKWQEEALDNQKLIAEQGLSNVNLKRDGKNISKEEWGLELLRYIKNINDELNLVSNEIILEMIDKIKDFKITYAYKMLKKVKSEGFVEANLSLAKKYKESAYKNRFKLEGYEDLELSTQILMKEAIKRGIKVDVLDRSENFISLKKCDKKEYVVQATKTSKDNYATILIMENKVVTKKVLEDNNIRVPKGEEYTSIEEAKVKSDKFIGKPIVIKPKSTNFGIGISIFTEGASKDDMIKAFEIAFENDKTVLIEEFIKGKEYRFLVIGDKVAGILHRVPANVIGDGKSTIAELVEIKNQDSLRGKGYKTPLEKIILDKNAELFLKQRGLDFNYIPKCDEIVYLRENSNISTGGDSIDYTDDIPQKFKDIAVKAAKAVKAKICGVDMMIEDYKEENSPYAIIELNFNPAIHIHSYPYKGKERKIAVEVLKLLNLIDLGDNHK
ncbi:bifunctional glutamate--cysteine ligase GshA/glutathione synthetase GshB [Clostridium sp. NSJ-145]|uniref:bifunctional glutamate--cysteine ligase GshA/glutathione synthetase GshB n=1 Tax=Clostridium sp. NSJ-145 TaxID=2897777 RepID=UPI001E5FBF2E|nr:bifunctional glutamate--cysteine ligase GshA/glutathione synthetase GshB [Clostridium sp. NSJ-145]MCD2500593.1 bifunctional glutamate--cysteine ligase GshA/glutathione synthetase GshB [Clostridium sp. NSJ-145]